MGQVIPLDAQAEAIPVSAIKLSYEEFLELYKDTHAEWVDGDILMGQPPTSEHQADSHFLAKLLGFYIEIQDAGELYAAPFQMRLAEQKSGREPDLMFISKEHLSRIKRTYLDGPADLIVEIISPESVGHDRGEKYVEYEAAGVREYWLIDPQRTQAEFYTLNDDHHYELILSGKAGKFESQVLPGFYLQIEWLWQKPLPKVAVILKEMGIL